MMTASTVTPGTIRVLVADDHAVVRLGIKHLLAGDKRYFLVAETATAADTLAAVRRWQPDVVVLDVRLPDGSGVEACRAIRAVRPETQVVMLTSFSDREALVAAVQAGAIGYVLKGAAPEQLVDAILGAAAGEARMDPVSTKDMLEWVQHRAPSNLQEGPLATLSDQERRTLSLIAEGKTNRQIGSELFVSDQTVKGYVSNILKKLGVSRRSEAAAFAARHLPQRADGETQI
jgi:two-component system, NarL family, response regulator DevR